MTALWGLGALAAGAGLAAVAGLGIRRWLERGMFAPGTVAERLGHSLDPLPDPAPDRWRVEPGIELFHDSFGQGDPLVFVHGGPGYPTRGRPRALAALAASHRVHLYDQRGCGRSTRPFERAPQGSFYARLVAVEGALGLAQQIADLERIRRALRAERLLLVGHSFGGLIAALYAAEFPDRARGLVLAAPAPLHVMPVPRPEMDLFAAIRSRLPQQERAAFERYTAELFALPEAMDLDEATLSRRYGALRERYARATGVDPVDDDGDAGGFSSVALYASLGRRHDWRRALGRIQAPVIALHGERDLASEDGVRALAAAIPGAEVRVVPGGHFLLDEAPDAVERAVRDVAQGDGRG